MAVNVSGSVAKSSIDISSSRGYIFQISEVEWPASSTSTRSVYLNLGWNYSYNNAGCTVTYQCGDSISVDQETGEILIDNPTTVIYGKTQTGDITTYGNLAGKYIKYVSHTGTDGNGYITTLLANTSVAWYIPAAITCEKQGSTNNYVYKALSNNTSRIKRCTVCTVQSGNAILPSWNIVSHKNYSNTFTDNVSTLYKIADFSYDIGKVPECASRLRFRVCINTLKNDSYATSSSANSYYSLIVSHKFLPSYSSYSYTNSMLEDSSDLGAARELSKRTAVLESLWCKSDISTNNPNLIFFFPTKELSVSSNKVTFQYIQCVSHGNTYVELGIYNYSKVSVDIDTYLEYTV